MPISLSSLSPNHDADDDDDGGGGDDEARLGIGAHITYTDRQTDRQTARLPTLYVSLLMNDYH